MGKLANSFRAGTELQEKADDDASLEDATLEVDTLELFDETVVVGAEDDPPPPPHEHKIKIGKDKHTINIFFIVFPLPSFLNNYF
jgi:hypothetical protein